MSEECHVIYIFLRGGGRVLGGLNLILIFSDTQRKAHTYTHTQIAICYSF